MALFALPHRPHGSRAGTGPRTLDDREPTPTLAIAGGWLTATETEAGFAIEVRARSADRPGATIVLARNLAAAAAELADAWPRAKRLRRLQWRGARITDCGRFVQVLADDAGARVEFAGVPLRTRDEVRAAAQFMLAWATWVARPAPIATAPVRGRRVTA
ncbi:MAG: hypothetical protein IT302_13840 [Dehalococcoidia bacterium]|nr:hypothetical protein [Dehalococcoidia bacterium]